jgi:hypothetical protein
MMTEQEYIKELGINKQANKGDGNSYVVDILNSDEYGRIYSILDKAIDNEELEMLEDNQVVTEQGSSLLYESTSEPYLLNLLADFDGDVYQLIINRIED